MKVLRTTVALLGLGLLATSTVPAATAADQPMPGARPPASTNDTSRPLQAQAPVRNSDNKPIESRTGINSDPNNPNGVARPSTDVKGN